MDEVKALLGNLQEPCRTAVILMLLTGMRIGEVLALRWGKIDWRRQTISLTRAYMKERFRPQNLTPACAFSR